MPYSSTSELPEYVQKLPAKRQRQWMHVWNSAYSSCKDGGGLDVTCESKAFAQANGVVKGAEVPNDGDKLPQNDSRVNYRMAEADATKKCANCRFFWEADQACSVVAGKIDGDWVSDLWTAKANSASEQVWTLDNGDKVQVFVEQSFSDTNFDQDAWIPFLPKPGKYQHPKFGEIDLTPERNAALVASVAKGVYQKHIPIDAEHETKLSGALAWIKGMRQNPDGSADANVEFTDRGRTLLKGGQFKYVSPEWFRTWTDQGTGMVHHDVVAGGAFTTRPFFKEGVLRALVATESGGVVFGPTADDYWFRDYSADRRDELAKSGVAMPDGSFPIPDKGALVDAIHAFGRAKNPEAAKAHIKKRARALGATDMLPEGWSEKNMADDPKDPKAEAPESLTMAEVEAKIKEATEAASATFTEKLAEAEAKLTAAETLAASEKTAREAATAEVTKIRAEQRQARFKDMIAGRGGDGDGAAWIGDEAKHLSVLTGLAETFGETVEEGKANPFGDYVENQKAIAAQAAEASLYTQVGSSANLPGSNEPEARLQALAAKKATDSGGKLTKEQAYAEILETPEGIQLYSASENAKAGRR